MATAFCFGDFLACTMVLVEADFSGVEAGVVVGTSLSAAPTLAVEVAIGYSSPCGRYRGTRMIPLAIKTSAAICARKDWRRSFTPRIYAHFCVFAKKEFSVCFYVTRAWFSGKTRTFQVLVAGSIPAARIKAKPASWRDFAEQDTFAISLRP